MSDNRGLHFIIRQFVTYGQYCYFLQLDYGIVLTRKEKKIQNKPKLVSYQIPHLSHLEDLYITIHPILLLAHALKLSQRFLQEKDLVKTNFVEKG